MISNAQSPKTHNRNKVRLQLNVEVYGHFYRLQLGNWI